MRRLLLLALAALALVGVVAPDAFAQAPTPKFTISGLIDQVGTYANNLSTYDFSTARNDKQFYGRTRGRFDFIGEVGKAKGVLGIEIDSYYGQTGLGDSNGAGSTTCVTNTGSSVICGFQGSGSESSFDLNTDTQANLQIKWLYTEFEVPLIPVPTVARLGAQPFGAAANYKLATYANGDFGGVNIVSTITPNVKLLFTYAGVEEALVGKAQNPAVALVAPVGATAPQARGDDLAFILSAEVTPLKGLDLKPTFSYLYINGITSTSARQGRGGYIVVPPNIANNTPAFAGVTNTIPSQSPFAPRSVAGADGVGTGIGENRYTVMLDGRWRIGGFSLDPTFGYQFGNRTTYNTVTPAYGVTCNTNGTPAINCTPNKASISAFLVDVRAGYQLGPLLIQGVVNYTNGNSAKDTLKSHVNFWQPLDTDTSYMADWGNQITALGVDYYQILYGGGAQAGLNPGVAIGYDKYGRVQLGTKASYALTPALTFGAGWTILYTARKVDTDSVLIANGGLLPSFVDRKTGRSARPEGDAQLIGNELNAAMTWRFAPGLALDVQASYLFAGGALAHRLVSAPYCDGAGSNGPCITPNGKELQSNDVYIATARVRFTF